MPIIYNVTIEPAETENRFSITWHNPDKNSKDCFTQESKIRLEETQ
jgi:hypothetical protein